MLLTVKVEVLYLKWGEMKSIRGEYLDLSSSLSLLKSQDLISQTLNTKQKDFLEMRNLMTSSKGPKDAAD